jgi:hypothetical protein
MVLCFRNDFEAIDQRLVFFRSRAVEPRRKDGDDLQDILSEVSFQARIIAPIEDNHLDALDFAKGENKLRSRRATAVLMVQGQPPDLSRDKLANSFAARACGNSCLQETLT